MRSGKDYKKWFLWGAVTFAVIVLIFVGIIKTTSCCNILPKWFSIALDILIALTTSAIAGLLVAIIIDTPAIIDSFRTMLTDSLASMDYLENLPVASLEDIRKLVVGLIHKSSCNVPDSFLQLDDELCRLIDSPYYSYLHEQNICSKRGPFSALARSKGTDENNKIQGLFYKKEVHLEFQITNPSRDIIEAEIGLTKYIDLPEECDLSEAFKIKAFEVSIDGEATYDICHGLVVERSKAHTGHVGSDPNTMTYDTIVRMSVQDNVVITKETISTLNGEQMKYVTEDTDHRLLARFNDNVRVIIIYSQICPIADSHYTRRLKYSAKNYTLNYSCQDDYKLHGQIIGTLIKQSDMSIIKNGDNNLTLICRNWLLPKNGAFIVMDDIVKSMGS